MKYLISIILVAACLSLNAQPGCYCVASPTVQPLNESRVIAIIAPSGIVDGQTKNSKGVGVGVPCGECMRWEIWDTINNTLYETITGLAGDPNSALSTNAALPNNSFLSFITNGSIFPCSSSTWQFNYPAFQTATGITDLEIRTFVGGSCGNNPSCPSESTNSDNTVQIFN